MAIVSSEMATTQDWVKREREYWIRRLSRDLERSSLVADYPRLKDYAAEKDLIKLKLTGHMYQLLTRLTSGSPFLIYATLMAALKVCLFRYTSNTSIVVGSPPLRELGKPNALAIVDEIDSRSGFREFLLQVRETLLEAYARQHYPFKRLVRDLKLKDVENRSPLFDIALAFAEIHGEMPDLKNDLTIILHRGANEIDGLVEFNSRLFKKETVERFRDHWVNVLNGALEKMEEPISRLPLITARERQQVLFHWNHTARERAAEATLPELFLRQVERTPEAIAVSYEGEQLSYEELNRRANQLAQWLRRRGVGVESVVGLLMERSVELVIGLLGVLKAGAAYLPLDPSYPGERLAYMVADAGVRVLLTQGEVRRRVGVEAEQVVCVDEQWAEIGEAGSEEVEAGLSGANLAYVIYTSGSTGRPKGAMNTHAGICNRLLWMQEEFALGAADRVLQKTPYSFDVSVWEFFWPLIVGARLVLARPGGQQESEYLVAVSAAEQITTLHFVPSMLEAFLEEEELERRCGSVRQVMSSGEVLSVELAERFYERLRGARLYNLYGPTEAAIDVSYWACEPGSGRRSVPIGRPIANLRLYILDEGGEPAALGVAGELHIGGVGLARGYWQRAELTAEKFIPDGVSGRAGERLYRTGDVARYQVGGEIEYVGRQDEQVKLRGYRIELGEVEAVVRQHEGVQAAVVVVQEGGGGGSRRLVCYVVWRGAGVGEGGAERGRQLQEYLRERLPGYMVPAVVLELAELPLQPNGKVDRKRLPLAHAGEVVRDEKYVCARTPMERMLVEMWSEVLGVEGVGIHDNFFDLGGHSLMTIKIASRIRKAFDVELPVRSLFEGPTVASLAERIESIRLGEYKSRIPKLERVPRDSTLPLSYAQQRLWLIDQFESSTVGYNIPGGVRLTGLLDVAELERSLNELVKRHESLRTIFISDNGTPVQVVAPHRNLKITTWDLRRLRKLEREAEIQRLTIKESQQRFDLARGEVVRAALLRLSEQEHVFLIVMHHIVSDGWSMGILISELATLYEAFSAGQPSPLPALPIQYADFAHWQRRWLKGELLEAPLAYWKKQLGNNLPRLNLPTDRPRAVVQTFRGATQQRMLDEFLTEALRKLGRSESATMFMTLLTAFKVLLAHYTGKEDIVVGTNVAGRDWLETEGLIGFFVNELVLRTDLSGNPTFQDLLGRVREVTLGAYAHQYVPFDRLVRALMPERNLSGAPLFQVLVDFQKNPLPPLRLPGLTISPIDINFGAAYFDLTLLIVDTVDRLSISLHYKTDLFDAPTIARMLENFEQLLLLIVTQPDARLNDLIAKLAKAEKQRRHIKQKANKAANQRDLQKLSLRATDGYSKTTG